MKLTTIQNITAEQWKDQASRFAKITDKVNSLTFPKTGVNNLKAVIEMEIVQPLSKGFRGRVKYIQHFEVPVGDTTTERTHIVVDYYEVIPRDMVNVMIDQFKDAVPSKFTDYLDIQDWIIEQAFIQQVVSKNTFGTLTADDYILSK